MKGQRVLLTGSRPERYAVRLREAGAVPVEVPTIAVRPIRSAELDRAVGRLARFDWVAVTSPNGVRAVFDRLRALDLVPPPEVRWAAVGPATASELEARGVTVAVTPPAGVGVALADALGDLAGRAVLLPRSDAASDDLPAALAARGAEVQAIDAYRTIEGPGTSRVPLAEALAGGVDAVVFTSGSTVRGFVRLAGDPSRVLGEGAAIVAIGPVTAAAAREAGIEQVAVARDRTPGGVVEALEEALHVGT